MTGRVPQVVRPAVGAACQYRGVDIRPITLDDLAVAPAWLLAADPRSDRWRNDSTRAVIGLDEDEIVASGRIFTTPVHASRYETEIIVAPDRRGRGLGSQVAAHLAELRPDPKPMCTRGYESSQPVRFARYLGAHPYQTCPPQHVRTSSAAALPSAGPGTVTAADVDAAELHRAWTDTYAWMHDTWSPVAPGFEQALLAGFDADIDLAHSRFVVDATVRAGAYVFQDMPKPVVVAECRTRDEPSGGQVLQACIRDCLLSLAADGTTAITFDGHDSDPHFRPLLDQFPTTGETFLLLEWT